MINVFEGCIAAALVLGIFAAAVNSYMQNNDEE